MTQDKLNQMGKEKVTATVDVENAEITAKIFGLLDTNVQLVEQAFGVIIRNRRGQGDGKDTLVVEGTERGAVETAVHVLEILRTSGRKKGGR